ncbi:uncharacterized protein C8Q71DRAFT_777549 [Rhodofomes roseus]|uniref:F-box domain-containing protein n=1 Tax=Rhodofomes roseus TaxID=34475 RepID=A0ABQ8K6F5_9APHY|nr:uncharacterized protein C8Q71DRAFT_777549 [Rhodofomes roseus]KAH9832661.1 hypothetical protein C8Q71DRAFT_777549 [Rhodofomes roseus]
MGFATLPTDILLLILRHLGVADIFALRRTSKALEDLTRSRSVWHDALHTHILARGLPLPGLRARSLDTLSAIELEELTFRALALRRNWTSSHPRSTRSAELVPPNIPPGARPRNLAVHYLPGREGRYLLTITLYDEPAAPRKYVVHCWDIGEEAGEPKVVAALRCTDLTGATVNTDPSHPGILAITRRGPSDDVTTSIFSIDFRARNVGAAFIPLQAFASFRFPLALEGSVFAASGPDNIVRVFDVEAGYVRAALRVPREYDDPTLRNEEHRCMGAVVLRGHVLTFCRQWIHLYALPSVPESPDNSTHPPPVAYNPIASHGWQWRIDSLVVTPRLLARGAAPTDEDAETRVRAGADEPEDTGHGGADEFPPIDVLIRFDTWFPWPVNILHHYVLTPNPAFTSSPPDAVAPDTPVSIPYLHPGGGPTMAHSIPSPIRLFTPSDMVLGRRGTALWLDAQAYESGPAQAGDHGQRIAGKVLASAGAELDRDKPSSTGEVDVAGQGGEEVGAGADSVSPGWYSEERVQTMVFHMQEEDDGWNKLAMDEDEGRIAVGTVSGQVHLFDYAPAAGL